ncbi:hypothetical protein FA95DRAFT_1187499 [Auriscalpium vulgare]|uniref:Uncharacterized protein n=1 Tax=Auriscalpium vulgare TaxID=40419 RepID=A0ACB8R4Z8_9AGAM|nr:hypothetical protein FA95DRAFT_1187499 [Auriscalpium vulgare]
MSLTLPIPSSPGNSSSADSPNVPPTPVSPTNPVQTLALPPSDQASGPVGSAASNAANAQAKRKPSRRANTAERRATHNAVERQRRETLNGRFLDLAALLPNLAQIRRPSKSAIVNSSIAHIHSSRRHRAMASREMRLLKLETDALRRELNEWRDRANLPRVEEPVRSEAFTMVLNGEVEILTVIPGMEDEDGDGYGDNDDDYPTGPAGTVGAIPEEPEETPNPMAAPFVKSTANPFAHNAPGPAQLTHILPRPAAHGRTVVAQTMSSMSFENPAMPSMYDSHIPSQQFQQLQYGHPMSHDNDKAAWSNQIMAAQQQMQQQMAAGPHGLFTPPGTSHGPVPNQGFGNPAYFAAMQRSQGNMHYGSPIDSEDASSVNSSLGRGRSASMNGSGYGSPPHGRPGSTGSYEMPGILASGMPMGGSAPIPVGGGGGNANGFAMMM